MKRLIAIILAITTTLNGVVMLVNGPLWYASLPGVTDTGPYNPHFVLDIGAAFLVAGIALGVGTWRPAYWPAAVTGAAFIALHGLIHLVAIASGHSHHTTFDLLAIVIPSALALYCAIPDKGVHLA
ncbi:hypothetical protein [Bradyrhizobium sp. SYSU BS000235]|uniref:hypothetical protein n=1 Tax=Bradyrhizobium sp. SYSU BS000235 TaxID=3411332 RepID=UPI003C75C325